MTLSPYAAPGIINKIPLTIQLIANSTCDYFKVDSNTVFSKSRKSDIIEVRQIVMYLSYNLITKNYHKIAAWFGIDHTTVMNACKRIQDRIDTEEFYIHTIEGIKNIIRQRKLGLN